MSKLQARIVLEILGRPPEHIKSSLSMLVERLSKEKGIKILDKKLYDPVPVKDTADLFTTFAEITVELESIEYYLGIIFAYMPSNIELIHPENLEFKNTDFNLLGNRIIARLHDYDALAKRVITERDIAIEKLQEFAPHLFKKQEQAMPAKQAKPTNSSKKKKENKKNKKKK